VRAAEAAKEVAALERRYQKSVTEATDRGAEMVLQDFEVALGGSRAVIARPPGDLFALAGSENQIYPTFHQLARAEIRIPAGTEWDRRRSEADAALFTNYEAKIRFAALTLDGRGLSNYGGCSIVLRSALIANRSSAMEGNSVLFAEKHRGRQGKINRVPFGYRSNWGRRVQLGVAKLANQIDGTTTSDKYSEILLRQGASSSLDEFVEIQIWGSVTVLTIEEVTIDTPKFKLEGIRIKTVESKLKNVGVKVKRWTR
jgi:hypothetical protein